MMWRKGLLPAYEPTFFDRYFLVEEQAVDEMAATMGIQPRF